MSVEEKIILFLAILFLATQVFWGLVTFKLLNRVMARDYSELKSWDTSKPKHKAKDRLSSVLPEDPEDIRITNEANKMFGMV